MSLNDCYPEFGSILECEKKTLEFLSTNFHANSEFLPLGNDASINLIKMKNSSLNRFEFKSKFNIRLNGIEGIVYIGSRLIFSEDDKVITYYFAICKNKKILRKYHFDHPFPSTCRRKPHPIFHLQYAGRLSNTLKEEKLDDTHLDGWLDSPRIYFTPMSLALLINLIFLEFPSINSKKIIETDRWRGLIKKNEELLFIPFFKICHDFISNVSRKELFINDFYYS